jgi:hypothetical protein
MPLVPRQRTLQETGGSRDGRIGIEFRLDMIIHKGALLMLLTWKHSIRELIKYSHTIKS